jgi:hypothetical protein
LTPFFSQPIAARDAIVDPAHFPIHHTPDLGQYGLLDVAQRVG